MLDNIIMNVVKTAENGVVDADTIFRFHQEGNTITAEYSGGKIKAGFLVGAFTASVLDFTYCQQRVSGELDHGKSRCLLSVDEARGKLRLEEQFEMDTEGGRAAGTNVFLEM